MVARLPAWVSGWKRQRSRYGPAPVPKDEELQLDFEVGSESDSEDGDESEGEVKGRRRSIKPMLWMVLSVVSTLEGRRLLRGGFGEC